MLKIGIIRERKSPPDTRVPLTPIQCKTLKEQFPVDFIIEPSPNRCFSDQEYSDQGLVITQDLSTCDVLLGVKEPILESILKDKTYFVFSHTIKAQPYNRELLKTFLQRNNRLIDYEVLTDEKGRRLIAFGFFAGLVGAHNALWTYVQRHKLGTLPRLNSLSSFNDVLPYYQKINWPAVKIVLTGQGRVASGSVKTLLEAGITQVSPNEFLSHNYNGPVFTQVGVQQYVQKIDGQPFIDQEFFDQPEFFKSSFLPYTHAADIMINGIYWDPKSPAFFSKDNMSQSDFNIEVIADITCDIAPESSIPSTLKPTTIDQPVFGYHPSTGDIIDPYLKESIDVMSIDNLPNEVPRDASESFGTQFSSNILPELLNSESSDILQRATIANKGQLGANFSYLEGYVNG